MITVSYATIAAIGFILAGTFILSVVIAFAILLIIKNKKELNEEWD